MLMIMVNSGLSLITRDVGILTWKFNGIPSGVLKGGRLKGPSFIIFGSMDDFPSYKRALTGDFPLRRLTTKGYIDIQYVYTYTHTRIYIYNIISNTVDHFFGLS